MPNCALSDVRGHDGGSDNEDDGDEDDGEDDDDDDEGRDDEENAVGGDHRQGHQKGCVPDEIQKHLTMDCEKGYFLLHSDGVAPWMM